MEAARKQAGDGHPRLFEDEQGQSEVWEVRRSTIEQRYARLIEALYDDSSEVPIEADVQYRDGRQARIETLVRVIAADAPVPVEA